MRGNSNPFDEKMLGQILVERNIISPRHLQLALDRQNQQKEHYKYIGEILIEMGIPQEKINDALDVYHKRKLIGQVFLDLKIITSEELQKALEEQTELAERGIRKPLGKLLIEMGYTNYDEYMDVLSKHFNLPIISLKEFFLSSDLQKAIGEAYAQKQQIVVLENCETKIKLALSEPTAVYMDELRRTFPPGKKVEFYLAHRSEMDYCLRWTSLESRRAEGKVLEPRPFPHGDNFQLLFQNKIGR